MRKTFPLVALLLAGALVLPDDTTPASASTREGGFLVPFMFKPSAGYVGFDETLTRIPGGLDLDQARKEAAWVHVDRLSEPSHVRFADGSCLTNVPDGPTGQRARLAACVTGDRADQMWTVSNRSLSIADPVIAGRTTVSYARANTRGLELQAPNADYAFFAGAASWKPPLAAKVESVDAAAGVATITGTARPGSTLLVDDDAAGRVPVTSAGTWQYTAHGLTPGDNVVTFDEYVATSKSATTSATVLLDGQPTPGPGLIEPTVSTTKVTAGVTNTFGGFATRAATIRILNVSNTQIVPGTVTADPATGAWAFDRLVSVGAPNFRFKIEQSLGGVTATSRLFTLDAE